MVKFPDKWLASLAAMCCVWVFFHVERAVLESSARSKSCLLEKTSYLRRLWGDSSKYSGRHWRTSNVICCCQHEIQCPNKEHHRNWPFSTQPPFKLWLVLVFKVHLTTFKTWRIKWRFKININYDIQTTSHDCFRSLKKIIVMNHVVVVNKRIQQNNISSLRLIGFSKNISSVDLKSYKRSDYNINTVDEFPNKSSFSFHCACCFPQLQIQGRAFVNPFTRTRSPIHEC